MQDDIYNFNHFLKRMIGKSYLEILHDADREVNQVEKSLYGIKGSVKRREMGGSKYVAQIKQFLFFMRYGVKPHSVESWDYRSYIPVVKALIEKGEFKPEILQLFNEEVK